MELYLPLKIKCFAWISLEDKILTWDNLLKKGFVGPSFCVLCKEGSESIHHLFVDCKIAKEVWSKVSSIYNIFVNWPQEEFGDCLEFWHVTVPLFREPPFIICWFLWKKRNSGIFYETHLQIQVLSSNIVSLHKGYSRSQSNFKVRRMIEPSNPTCAILGFFYGPATPGKSGVGIIILVSDRKRFALWMGYGSSTKTRVESLALWGLPQFSQIKELVIGNIYSDSKVVIYWVANKASIQVDRLEKWCTRVQYLKEGFANLSFFHIYRKFNKEADLLPKKTFGFLEGILFFEEIEDFIMV